MLINERGVEEVVADKGYHSNEVLVDLHADGVRSYIPEPQRGPGNGTARKGNRSRCMGTGGE